MVYDYAYNEPTLVMATKGTIKSEKFNMLFNKYDNHKTYLLSCVGLADIIEKDNKEEIQKYLHKNLGVYSGKVKNVVLGCTHYPLIKKEIKNVLGNVEFFEGSERLAIHLKHILAQKGLLTKNVVQKTPKIEFIDSSFSEQKKERFYEILEGEK